MQKIRQEVTKMFKMNKETLLQQQQMKLVKRSHLLEAQQTRGQWHNAWGYNLI